MFYDLNVPEASKAHGSDKRLQQTLAMLSRVGYDVVAINKTVGPGLVTDPGPAPEVPVALPPGTPSKQTLQDRTHKLKQLTRLTVLLDHQRTSFLMTGSTALMRNYDIVAVQPTSEAYFSQACQSLDVDIISLDLSQRLPFLIKIPPVGVAIQRGIHFEISYSAAIEDSSARQQLIANAMSLLRCTRGRNIILTSKAERALHVRGPFDVASLGRLFGMNQEHAKMAVSANGRAVVLHGQMRGGTAKGVVSVAPVSSTEPWAVPTLDQPAKESADAAAKGGKKLASAAPAAMKEGD